MDDDSDLSFRMHVMLGGNWTDLKDLDDFWINFDSETLTISGKVDADNLEKDYVLKFTVSDG